MKTYFFDTSAIVKRYVAETGSTWLNNLLLHPETSAYISRLTEAEVSAALTRRLLPAVAQRVLHDFDQDLAAVYSRLDIINQTIDNAIGLARTLRLRGCDALQLAAALQLAQVQPQLIFVCADADLLSAAASSGLGVENPETHT